jgi:hypothetical protein
MKGVLFFKEVERKVFNESKGMQVNGMERNVLMGNIKNE